MRGSKRWWWFLWRVSQSIFLSSARRDDESSPKRDGSLRGPASLLDAIATLSPPVGRYPSPGASRQLYTLPEDINAKAGEGDGLS